MAYDYDTGLLVGQGIAASHALSSAVDAVQTATRFIEATLAAMPPEVGIASRVRTDIDKLRGLLDRLDATSAAALALRRAA